MTITDEVEEAGDMLISVLDEFVYEDQTVHPEDVYFVSLLLQEYYKSQSPQSIGSPLVCEVAWTFAKEIAGYVETNDDFDWINAHFVLDGAFNSVRSDHLEYPDREWDTPSKPNHFTSFEYGSDAREYPDSLEDTTEVLDEILETLELYVEFEESDTGDSEGLDKPREIAMTISHIGKRYAHEFPDDMLESSVSFQLINLLLEVKEAERFSERDVFMGLRLATNWTELRAKREHDMLCVGLK